MTRRVRRTSVVFLAALVALSGCALVTPHPVRLFVSPWSGQVIVVPADRRLTDADLQRTLGAPTVIRPQPGGGQIWEYRYPGREVNLSLSITLLPGGIVDSYSVGHRQDQFRLRNGSAL